MYLDEDTTDDFLDAPEPVYEPIGRTLAQRLESQGFDLRDLGTLADQLERRQSRRSPELPPPTDR